MRNYLIVIFMLTGNILQAQNKVAELKLNTIDIKKKSVPFFFKEVTFTANVSDTLGIIATRKNKEHTFARLENPKTGTLLNFLQTQFDENKKSTPIILEIKKLRVAPTEDGIFNPKDTFQFQAEFIGILNNERNPLFTFNAKNQFGTFEDAENVMANYIARALVSAVEKFRESYDKKAEWHQEFANESNGDTKPVKVNATLNKLSKDTMPCAAGSKLSWDDFQENKKDNGPGSAKFILTYKVAAEETSKNLKLDIYVNAFYNKKNSWKPRDARTENWLNYHQGHFDICAVYGTKLYNAMKNYTYSLGEYRAELNKIYNEYYTEYVKLRKQYETETAIGTIEEQNTAWRKKIDDMLRETKSK